jgi:hypothetical protein
VRTAAESSPAAFAAGFDNAAVLPVRYAIVASISRPVERDPTWRRPVQHSLFDLAFATSPKRHIVFALAAAAETDAAGRALCPLLDGSGSTAAEDQD